MSFYKFSVYLIAGFTFSLGNSQSNSIRDADHLREILKVFFVPVETNHQFLEDEKGKIDLGRYLFFDERLSSNSKISCNSCHNLETFGTNGDLYLEQKQKGGWFRDVPTIYNVNTLPIYNTDGGINSIKDKLEHVFSNPYEMNVKNTQLLIDRLQGIEGYRVLFKEVFPNDDDISFENVKDALETYIKGLITPSPMDSFIKGDDNALSLEQIEGGHLFNDKSCYSCHTGSNVGGQMIQKLGIEVEWPNQKDLGYYHTKRLSAYKMFFRVAPLRNVEKTGPYFHDGSSARLWQAVKLMGKHERGLDISTSEAMQISEFLKSLTGDIPLNYIKKPTKLVN